MNREAASFARWRQQQVNAAPQTPVLNRQNLCVYSYRTDRLIYLSLNGREYSDSINLTSEAPSEAFPCIPYMKANEFYPRLILDIFTRMRYANERDSRTDLQTKIVSIRGWRYTLSAWITSTERHGKICVFTCSHTVTRGKTDHKWHKRYFDSWFQSQLRDPDPTYWQDQMWCRDYKGLDYSEIEASCIAHTPQGKKPTVNLLRQVFEPGILQACENRVGANPYRMSMFRVPPLELIFTQRTRLVHC